MKKTNRVPYRAYVTMIDGRKSDFIFYSLHRANSQANIVDAMDYLGRDLSAFVATIDKTELF